jgi:Dyp-type peroxidase family
MFQLTQDARADIQGIITSGYGHLPDARYVFVEFTDAGGARAWLERLIPEVTTARPWPKSDSGKKLKPPTALNIAFTCNGFAAIGLSEQARRSFQREFLIGMAKRFDVLGDTGASAPDSWEIGGPDRKTHAVLMLYGADETICQEFYAGHRQRIADAGGIREIAAESGHRFDPPEEHFGFQDGIAQPAIEGVKKRPDPGQTPISTGEFILGYPTEFGGLPPTIGVPRQDDPNDLLPPFPERSDMKDFGRHGTYLVYRKLEQCVAAFWNFVEAQVKGNERSMQQREQATTLLAAKLVGRWRSGAPVVLTPDADDPKLGMDEVRNNDFLFMPNDPDGFACPFAAHIRRANPRDSMAENPGDESLKTSNRHRLMRRGIPYGEQLVKDTVLGLNDDGKSRGLHFFALNANIKRQFEFVQQQWLNNPKFGGLYDDRDPIVSDGDGQGSVSLQRPIGRKRIPKVPRFVVVKGGGYFFLPSMTALRFLSR